MDCTGLYRGLEGMGRSDVRALDDSIYSTGSMLE